MSVNGNYNDNGNGNDNDVKQTRRCGEKKGKKTSNTNGEDEAEKTKINLRL